MFAFINRSTVQIISGIIAAKGRPDLWIGVRILIAFLGAKLFIRVLQTFYDQVI
jgi:hypothetical protein